jgi:hypothetical protein
MRIIIEQPLKLNVYYRLELVLRKHARQSIS